MVPGPQREGQAGQVGGPGGSSATLGGSARGSRPSPAGGGGSARGPPPAPRNRPPLCPTFCAGRAPTPGGGTRRPLVPATPRAHSGGGELQGPLPHAAPFFLRADPHPSLSPTPPSPGPPRSSSSGVVAGGPPDRQDVPPGKAPGEWGPRLRGGWGAGRPGTQTWASPSRPRFSPASPSSSRSWRSATASKKNSSFFRLSTTGKGLGTGAPLPRGSPGAEGGVTSVLGGRRDPRAERGGLQVEAKVRRTACPVLGHLEPGKGWGRPGSGSWGWVCGGGESQSHHCGSWPRRGPVGVSAGGQGGWNPKFRPLPSLKLECEKLASEDRNAATLCHGEGCHTGWEAVGKMACL